MSNFGRRLDAWLDKVVDLEALLPGSQVNPIPLKVIFDNLRYYPVLAFMWIGVRLLRDESWWLAGITSGVLRVLTIGLGLLVAYQTAWIWIAAIVAMALALLPLKARDHILHSYRSRSEWLYAVAASVTMVVIFCATAIAATIVAALSRAGLL